MSDQQNPNNPSERGFVLDWEPQSLGTHQLEDILTRALEDLWADAWRQGQPKTEQMLRFKRITETALYEATAIDLAIGERRYGKCHH